MTAVAAARSTTHLPPNRREVSSARGLRVLAFCDYFGPVTGGGAERVAREVYRRLAAWGAEVTVVTTAGAEGDGWGHEMPGVRIVEASSVELTSRLGVQASLTRGCARLAAEIAAVFRPHVLHANSLQFQTALVAARVQPQVGVPLVTTAHIGGFEHMRMPWRALAGLHERTVGRLIIARSARVIAVSAPVADHLRRYPTARRRLRVVANGIDHGRFQPSELAEPNRERLRLLCVGRLVANKGPDVAIEAVEALHRGGLPVHLTLVGEGPMRARLQERVGRDGLAGIVTFAGASLDVAAHMRDADVLVRPTQTEGMPLAVLEAMASGLCVVASDVPGNASLIGNDRTGVLVRPRDPEALAAAIRDLAADPRRRRRLAANGLAASKAYSWDRCAEQTLGVLLEAVNEATGRLV